MAMSCSLPEPAPMLTCSMNEEGEPSLSAEGDGLVIPPLEPEAESLAALLERSSPEQFRVEDDEVWLNAEPVGSESA